VTVLRSIAGLSAFFGRPGRHRRPEPPMRVTVVTRDGTQMQLPEGSVLGKAIGQAAAILAGW
jgi:hypothetical protein